MISLTCCQCTHREKENFLQPADEDFQERLVHSCLDKESQLERIQFPLPGSGYSSESAGDALENEQYFSKKEDFPFLQDCSKLDRNEYSYCTRVDAEIACELLQGKGFGIGAKLIYKNLDGMWYLVYLEKANIYPTPNLRMHPTIYCVGIEVGSCFIPCGSFFRQPTRIL
jgi:hypothetical protein